MLWTIDDHDDLLELLYEFCNERGYDVGMVEAMSLDDEGEEWLGEGDAPIIRIEIVLEGYNEPLRWGARDRRDVGGGLEDPGGGGRGRQGCRGVDVGCGTARGHSTDPGRAERTPGRGVGEVIERLRMPGAANGMEVPSD